MGSGLKMVACSLYFLKKTRYIPFSSLLLYLPFLVLAILQPLLDPCSFHLSAQCRNIKRGTNFVYKNLFVFWCIYLAALIVTFIVCWQKDNVSNQREHVVHLLANEQTRLGILNESEPVSLRFLHQSALMNSKSWGNIDIVFSLHVLRNRLTCVQYSLSYFSLPPLPSYSGCSSRFTVRWSLEFKLEEYLELTTIFLSNDHTGPSLMF